MQYPTYQANAGVLQLYPMTAPFALRNFFRDPYALAQQCGGQGLT